MAHMAIGQTITTFFSNLVVQLSLKVRNFRQESLLNFKSLLMLFSSDRLYVIRDVPIFASFKKIKTLPSLLTVGFLIFSLSSGWGQAASSTWVLTGNATSTNIGNVVGSDALRGGGGATFLASGISSNSWEELNIASAITANDYYEYAITPTSGNSLLVSSISFAHSVSSGPMSAGVYYSLNNFSSSTQLGTTISVPTTESTVTNSSSITVLNGETLKIRVYGWGANTSGRAYRNKNFVISGTTTSVCTSPTISSCPTNQTANTALNSCTAVVTYATPSTTGTSPVNLSYVFSGVTTGSGSGTGSGSTFNKGVTIVTITATNSCGTSSCSSFNITVNDTQAPTATCQAVTVQLNAAGTASVTAAQVNNGSSDNCTAAAALTLLLNKLSFNCSNLGANTVILTVTDGSGNSSTCSAVVTVEDKIAPTATCQAVTIQLNAAGTASVTAAQVNNGSTDNCTAASSLTLSLNNTSFNCSNLGTNTVILTVTDGSGNSSTCSAVVTVEDKIAPTATCQAVTVQLNAAGTASVTAAQVNNGSSDNCSIATMSVSPSSFTCSNVGTNTVIFTVTDASNNSSTCSAIITVQDLIAPTAICKAATVVLNQAGTASITASDINNGSYDNCSLGTLSVNPNTFTSANVGSNTVTLTVPDVNGNSSSCTAIVTVNRRPTTLTYTGDAMEQYSDKQLLTATLIDNLTNSGISGKTISFSFILGTQTITSVTAVTDASGIATVDLILTQAPGSYTLSSIFEGDGTYTNSSDSDPFTIKQEDARATYTGVLYAATSSATSSTATITLTATIQDITAALGDPAYDGFAGDIRNAKVTFINRENGTPINTLPLTVGLVNTSDTKTGTAIYNWPVNIGSAQSTTFLVGIIVSNYYTRNSSTENTVITVSKPLDDFVTGGGYLVLSNSAGVKSGDAGTKCNFGFNVKYNKSGKNLQGNINTIFRRTEGGVLRTYQIKGNAMTSLAIPSAANALIRIATYTGKASLQDVTDPNNVIPISGNATLKVDMTDRGEPGTSDDIAITVWDNTGGMWFSSNWSGTATTNQVLAAGNIQVRGGNISTTSASALAINNATNNPLQTAYMNPSELTPQEVPVLDPQVTTTPSRTTDMVTVYVKDFKDGNATVRIYNLMQRIEGEWKFNVQNNKGQIELNLSNQIDGVYIIVVDDESRQQRMTQKVVKVNRN